MKRFLALLLAAMMIVAGGTVSALADAGSEPDWAAYDALIA